MLRNTLLVGLSLVVVTIGWSLLAQEPPSVAVKGRTAIEARDLGERFEVHGPLGPALGEVVTVEAEAILNSGKGERHQLRVRSVDGRALDELVTLPYSMWPWSNVKQLEQDRRYRLRLFQTGGFNGVPEQAMKETVFVQTRSYGFTVSLVVVRAL